MAGDEITFSQASALISLAFLAERLSPICADRLTRIPHRHLICPVEIACEEAPGGVGIVCLLEGLTAFPDVFHRVLDAGLDPRTAPFGGAGVLGSAVTAESSNRVSAVACAAMVDRLIAAGVDPETDRDGATPLSVALGLSIELGRVPAALPRLLAACVRLEVPRGGRLVPVESLDGLPAPVVDLLHEERASRADPE